MNRIIICVHALVLLRKLVLLILLDSPNGCRHFGIGEFEIEITTWNLDDDLASMKKRANTTSQSLARSFDSTFVLSSRVLLHSGSFFLSLHRLVKGEYPLFRRSVYFVENK